MFFRALFANRYFFSPSINLHILHQRHESERRIKMAQWAAYAWLIVQQKTDYLRSAFVSTGFLVAADRSEDHLIKMTGLDNYTFH